MASLWPRVLEVWVLSLPASAWPKNAQWHQTQELKYHQASLLWLFAFSICGETNKNRFGVIFLHSVIISIRSLRSNLADLCPLLLNTEWFLFPRGYFCHHSSVFYFNFLVFWDQDIFFLFLLFDQISHFDSNLPVDCDKARPLTLINQLNHFCRFCGIKSLWGVSSHFLIKITFKTI